jgi:hypothetical protein
VCLALMALASSGRPASSDAEDVLKSAAVWGFLRYSEWPPTSDNGITVGVLGRSDFAQVLRQTLEGKTVQNRPVHVVDFRSDPRCCQVIYFATDRAPDIRHALENEPRHVLTIGEDDRFIDYGGTVRLFVDDGHIAFETSLDALAHCGIKISASLLRLGQIRERGRKKAAQ